jgi:hypothetical protein
LLLSPLSRSLQQIPFPSPAGAHLMKPYVKPVVVSRTEEEILAGHVVCAESF